ncbi:MAG TPA: MFS transporter [Acidimicrobiales bacterium]|nr:MFS transporter [Acidimicrobiales bacterium]
MRGANLAALRHRPLAAFLAGNLVSNCGTWVQNIALSVFAYRRTGGDTFWVGVMGFSQFAAVGILAPWSGRAADRMDRRRLSSVAAGVSAALGGLLALLSGLDLASVPTAAVVALVAGVATAFATPAMKALVTGLVPADEVGRAMALESASYNLARVIGPLVGAAVVAGLGLTWAFALNALSFLGLVVGLRWARSPGPPRRAPTGPVTLASAVRLVRRQPILVAAFAVVAGVSMASDAVTTLGPELCTDVLGRSDAFAGALVGAFGFGAVSVVLATSPSLRTTPARLAARCLLMALGLAGLATLSGTVAVLVALAVAGGGFLAANTEASTSIQMGVGDDDRGRVSALWAVAFLGVRPVASLVLGATARLAGVRVAAAVAIVPLALALLALRWAAARSVPARPVPAPPARRRAERAG